MNDQESEVRLSGDWPEGIEAEVLAYHHDLRVVRDDPHDAPRTMLPWGDIGTLAAAAAAAVTLGLQLWDRVRGRFAEVPEDLSRANSGVKETGNVAVVVAQVRVDSPSSSRLEVDVLHLTSGRMVHVHVTRTQSVMRVGMGRGKAGQGDRH